MTTFSRSELDGRHEALKTRLDQEDRIDAALFVQKADLYYLSGTTQQAHLLVPRSGAARLLVRKVLDRAREDSALDDIRPMRSLKELRAQMPELCGSPPWRIGMELDVLSVNQLRAYERVFDGDAEIVDVSPDILAVRARKSDWEVEQLRDGARLHELTFAELPELLAEDISTFELQARLDASACKHGHCGVIRMRGLDLSIGIGIVVSGVDGAYPGSSMFPIGGRGPHACVAAGGTRARIERDTPIIVDYLMSTSGYHADCTRMAVKGDFPDEARKIFDGLCGILRHCESRLVVGSIPSKIYAEAVEMAAELGLSDGFMGPPGYQVPFIGHAVGLEVNEAPVLAPRFDEPLVSGNVLAIEPKFTHPEFGVIGVENSYLVSDSGAVQLTNVSEEIIRC